MKKIVTILVLVCYSIASFGVSVNYFYCGSKLETVSFIVEKKCSKCKCDANKGCCKTQKKIVKLKTDQKSNSSQVYQFDAPISTTTIHYCNYVFANAVEGSIEKQFYQLPPPKLSFKRNILFCVYRI